MARPAPESKTPRARGALIDDEPLARLRLRTLLADLPELDTEVVAEAGDAVAALSLLQHVAADVVLLDIQMPGFSRHEGLRLAALLRTLPAPPALVFVTAHEGHALQAFELHALDYLTKPVRLERLRDALLRVRVRARAPAAAAADAGAAAAEPAADGPVLVISDRGRLLRLPVHEVLVLKAEQKYVTLRTAAHQHVLDDSLSELEQRLQALGGDFIRIHRNALVARRAVRALALRGAAGEGDGSGDGHGIGEGDGWMVRVAPMDEWLAVSRRQVATLKAALAAG